MAMGCLVVKPLVFFNLEIFVVRQLIKSTDIGSLAQIELQVWRIGKGDLKWQQLISAAVHPRTVDVCNPT
jgi:hypothetical protein